MNPSEQGFLLEDIIYNAVNQFSVLAQNMRETQIKQHFQDNSLNGVDHWIKFGKNNILIQDKWREDTTQQEVSQFLECTNRLNRRIPRDENIYLLWVSKYGPTKNSMISLNERGVEVITCSISIQSLARLAVLRIAECLDIDPVAALISIPKDIAPIPVERASVIMDEEAMEILRIRRELNEKKKQEEQQKLIDESRVREILLNDPALSWKMRVSPNDKEFQYWPQSPSTAGYSYFQKWNPNEGGKSTKDMLKAYNEIEEFRSSSIDIVKSAVKRAMDDIWSDSTDERIFQKEEIQNSGGCGWGSPDIQTYLGTKWKKNTDEDYWQTLILNEQVIPILNEEWTKYYYYCKKFLERSHGKPRIHEALEKINNLEKQIITLQNKNEALEEKLTSIRKLMNN
jgi:hypothetical protein